MNALRTLSAEWEPHRCTVVCWPTRDQVWGDVLPLAKREYCSLVKVASEDEPVLVVCREEETEELRRQFDTDAVAVLAHQIDDGWIRDNGPIIVRNRSAADGDGSLVAIACGFNSWGNRFSPTIGDLSVRRAIAQELDLIYEDATADLVLEGGAVSSNGKGTLLVAEECVLTESRNPGMTKADFERIVADRLGAQKVIWVPHGLLEDLPNTDGHVDNVAVFIGTAEVLVQAVEPTNPNSERPAANADRLRYEVLSDGNRLRIVECPILPYAGMPDGSKQAVPYLNFVLTNASVILPSGGDFEADRRAARLFTTIFPQRRVRFTPSIALAYGGGGPHCVSLNIPRD